MENRNTLLESDGLAAETESHEWFKDSTATSYAQRKNLQGIALPSIAAFVLREKKTGEYMRVLYCDDKKAIIFDSQSIEGIGTHIDLLKTSKLFSNRERKEKQKIKSKF